MALKCALRRPAAQPHGAASFELARVVQRAELREEGLEEHARVEDVVDAHRLATLATFVSFGQGKLSRVVRAHRMECMLRLGMPTSAVRSPTRAAMMGPIVVPHGQSLRTMNSCTPIPARRESSRITKPVGAVVAYRWLSFDLMTVPALSFLRTKPHARGVSHAA